MKLFSHDFEYYGHLSVENEFNGMDGMGNNVSPQLFWKDIPKGSKSLALTVYDPDAPTGSGFWHWVVCNIPIDTQSLERNAGNVTGETRGIGFSCPNDFGLPGYGGPCPPIGAEPHRYEFTLHALSVASLEIDASTTNAVARFLINMHSIQAARTTAIYGRS